MATAAQKQTFEDEQIEEESVGVIGDERQPLVQDEESKRIRRKFDRRLMPLICCLYVLSYLDRGNIGNAKAAGAREDLGLSDSQWAWVLNSFYIIYVCFEWATLFWKLFPAHIYISILCICWGASAMCAGAAQNMSGLVACRMFLGFFEAAFGAGAPYFLSLFYRRKELGLRVSLLLGMSPLANCFSSTLAYEGVPTIAFAPLVWLFLPDSPGTAKYLDERQRTLAVERLHTKDTTKKTAVKWSQVFSALTDYKNYVHSAIHFCCNYSFAALSNFLPTIVKDMGYSSVNAQGLTAPVYFASFLCCLVAAHFSDRFGKRGFLVTGFAAMGAAGYLILTLVQEESRTGARYAGIWLATCGVFPPLALNVTWMLNNQGGDSKKGIGMAVLATLGQCSSFVSSAVFPSSDGPFYTRGCAIGCALTGTIVLLSIFLHSILERENRRRDREYGIVDGDMDVDVTELGDGHKNFRYLT